MRRDAAKAEDYAARHGVAKWYTTVEASQRMLNSRTPRLLSICTGGCRKYWSLFASLLCNVVLNKEPMSIHLCCKIFPAAHMVRVSLKASGSFSVMTSWVLLALLFASKQQFLKTSPVARNLSVIPAKPYDTMG